jgi:hypothetical protein
MLRPFLALSLLAATLCSHAEEPPSPGSPTRDPAALWAFQPPVRPTVPASQGPARSPIDAFVQAGLEARALALGPEADRRVLIRRLYLDVLGLPPAPEEVDAFLADGEPQAYERLVDRVLASPHYGERWARHWLDVVRFAETNGFEMNQPRPNAWPYRDYVIRALNEDKPYTDFIREQLAGDALGVDEATGFLVGGPWDQVTSPDVVLTKNQRDSELHDIVSTTSSAFLGLTVGCAKCHDHKFDPISQRDYFSMRAVFAGVRHGERPLQVAEDPERKVRLTEAREELAAVRSRLLQFVKPASVEGVTAEQVAQTAVPPGPPQRTRAWPHENLERFAPVQAKYVRMTIFASKEGPPCIDELEVRGAEGKNLALASGGAVASASSEYPGSEIHKIVHLNDGLYGNFRSWIPEGETGWVQIELPEPALVDTVTWARDREKRFTDRVATRYVVEVALEPGTWRLVASSWDRVPPEDMETRISPYAPEAEVEGLLARQEALQKAEADLAQAPRVYAGTFEEPETTKLLFRGDPMMEREAVDPGAPANVQPALSLPPTLPERERRLRLADWIAGRDNPLTARVMVNRIWHYHFGRGIVETPSDFGAMGVRPSHPELLDWLAVEFMENGWRMKHIHRLILLSQTYRQSSAPRADALAVDRDAKYLWRFAPRRLEAEPLRDSILWATGALDLRMGGPGFQVFEPNDNYVRVYTPKKEFAQDEFRRMIYQYKPRSQPEPTFGIFDCPDGGQTAPRRVTSTTPLQALNLLNSPFMQQQAELFAERVKREAGVSLEQRVAQAFRLALGRTPDPEEIAAADALVQDHGLVVFCKALLNASELLYLQ